MGVLHATPRLRWCRCFVPQGWRGLCFTRCWIAGSGPRGTLLNCRVAKILRCWMLCPQRWRWFEKIRLSHQQMGASDFKTFVEATNEKACNLLWGPECLPQGVGLMGQSYAQLKG